jgi:hypothetical protein
VRLKNAFGFAAGVMVDDRTGEIACGSQTFGEIVWQREQKTWRELCDVARKSNDPYELLRILRELNKALRREG